MALVYKNDDKSAQNQARSNQADKVVDSALLFGANQYKKQIDQHVSSMKESDKQQEIQEPEQVETQEQPTQQQNGETPFTNAMGDMATVTWEGTKAPSYNVNDVFKTRIESTDAPVRDAAQDERLKKMSKFNLISTGLQAVFGGMVGAKGGIVPSPYEGGMTQNLMQNLQGLDDKQFREMAEWRDRELKAQMFNSNQESKADQARIQKNILDIQNLTSNGRYKEAREAQDALNKYREGQDVQQQKNFETEVGLKKTSQNIANKRQNSQDINDQYNAVQAAKGAVSSLESHLKAKKADTDSDPAEIADIEAQLKQAILVHTDAVKQFNEGRGMAYNEPETTGGDINQRVSTIIGKLDSNGYKNEGEAINEMAQAYIDSGYGKEESLAQAKKDIQDNGYFRGKEQNQKTEPTEKEYPDPIDLAVKKLEYKSNSVANDAAKKEQAKSDIINQKEGELKNHLGDALSIIGDVSFADKVRKSYGTSQDSVIKESLSKLEAKKKTLEDKINGKGFFSISATDKQDHDDLLMVKLLIVKIKDSAESYKKHKQSHGK